MLTVVWVIPRKIETQNPTKAVPTNWPFFWGGYDKVQGDCETGDEKDIRTAIRSHFEDATWVFTWNWPFPTPFQLAAFLKPFEKICCIVPTKKDIHKTTSRHRFRLEHLTRVLGCLTLRAHHPSGCLSHMFLAESWVDQQQSLNLLRPIDGSLQAWLLRSLCPFPMWCSRVAPIPKTIVTARSASAIF